MDFKSSTIFSFAGDRALEMHNDDARAPKGAEVSAESADDSQAVDRRSVIKKSAAASVVAGVVWSAPKINGLSLRPSYAAAASTTSSFAVTLNSPSGSGLFASPVPSPPVSNFNSGFISARGPAKELEIQLFADVATCLITGVAISPASWVLGSQTNSDTTGRFRRQSYNLNAAGNTLPTVEITITCT